MPYKLRTPYNDVVKFFEKEGCKLITTEEEIISVPLNFNSKFKYIPQCGHHHVVQFRSFKTTPYGRLCPKCQHKKTSEKYKQNMNYGIHHGIKIETESFNYIIQFLSNKIDFHRTYEGCHADIIVRPLNSQEDKWLPVQLKGATFNDKNTCRFRHVDDYNKYLMCCIGMKNDTYKIWMFNGSLCLNLNGVTISPNSKTYSKYEVSSDKIIEKLLESYNDADNFTYISYATSMIPVAPKCKTEHCNRMKRSEYLSDYFDISYSNEMNNIYDCKINNVRVQDKSGHPHRSGISFGINKKLHKKSIPYEKGDIDIYWLHVPNSSKFYVIPENVLIFHNFIKTPTQHGKLVLILFPEPGQRKNSKEWAQEYLFDYKNLNIAKLKTLFMVRNM